MGNHGSPENTGFPEGDGLVLSVGGPPGIHADKSEANGNGCFDAKVDPSKSNENDSTGAPQPGVTTTVPQSGVSTTTVPQTGITTTGALEQLLGQLLEQLQEHEI